VQKLDVELAAGDSGDTGPGESDKGYLFVAGCANGSVSWGIAEAA